MDDTSANSISSEKMAEQPMNKKALQPLRVRVSMGSAVLLRLLKAKVDVLPTTVYLMTHRQGKCVANCGFCPQARESRSSSDMLSRVSWPVYELQPVTEGIARVFLEGEAKRVCIQALNYQGVFADLSSLVNHLRSASTVPISVSCQPFQKEDITSMFQAGAERIGIPLDAAAEEIFKKTKGICTRGPYDWSRQFELLREAVDIFGSDRVSTHLIVGLGETEKEMVKTIQKCVDMEVLPGLFAFTPIPGTALAGKSQPQLDKFRRIQLARYLIAHRIARYEGMSFDNRQRLTDFGIDNFTLIRAVDDGEAFFTSGCPDCNRPYYNEKPSGPLYNFPRKPTQSEVTSIKNLLKLR